MTVLEILKTRFDETILKDFRESYFNEEKTKFFAYTIHNTNSAGFEDFYHFYLDNKAYSTYKKNSKNEDRYRIYNDNGTYSNKNLKQLLEEKIITFIIFKFFGVYYNEEWYVLDEFTCFEENTEEDVISFFKSRIIINNELWEINPFAKVPEFEKRIDYRKVEQMIFEQTSEKLSMINMNRDDSSKIRSFIDSLNNNEIPYKAEPQFVNFREFIGQPWLVAYKKQEIKSTVNSAFEDYINEAVFIPFAQALKNQMPDKFKKTFTLNSPTHFPLIYSHSKDFILCLMNVLNANKESRLYYFFYLPQQKIIYEWIYPKTWLINDYYLFYTDERLTELSTEFKDFYLTEPSITIDDINFWNEYVLKKENEKYIYLVTVPVQNFQQDIYPSF